MPPRVLASGPKPCGGLSATELDFLKVLLFYFFLASWFVGSLARSLRDLVLAIIYTRFCYRLLSFTRGRLGASLLLSLSMGISEEIEDATITTEKR